MSKIEQIRGKVRDAVLKMANGSVDEVACEGEVKKLIDSLCEIESYTQPTPPSEATFGTFRIPDMGRHGGTSVKVENIRLKKDQVPKALLSHSLSVAGAAMAPILLNAAILLIALEVKELATHKLSTDYASAVVAMLTNKDKGRVIYFEKAFNCSKNQFKENKLGNLDEARFRRILEDLQEWKCIDLRTERDTHGNQFEKIYFLEFLA